MKNVIYLILISISTTSIAQDLKNGLVAKYLFNFNLADSSSYNNDLEVYNPFPVTYGQDRFGDNSKAIAIYPNSNYDNFYTSSLPLPEYSFANTFSISFWYKVENFNPLQGDIIYHGSPDGNTKTYSIQYGFNSEIQFMGNTFGDSNRGEGFHHYVITYNNGQVNLFTDQVKSSSTLSNITLPTMTTNYLVVGKMSDLGSSPSFNPGYIDDIYVYNRVLSQQEVNLLYDLNTVKTNHLPVSDLNLFYNSSTQQLVSKTKLKSVSVYNSMGQQIISNHNINLLNVQNINSGLYFVKAISNSNQLISLKFVKK